MTSFNGSPIVLHQTRWAGVAGAAFGLLGLAFGLSPAASRTLLDGLFPASWMAVPLSLLFLGWSLLALVQPARLILAPEGFAYRIFLRTQAAPWSALAAIDRSLYRGQPRGVSLRLANGRRVTLAGGWPLDIDDLMALIAEAHKAWSHGESASPRTGTVSSPSARGRFGTSWDAQT